MWEGWEVWEVWEVWEGWEGWEVKRKVATVLKVKRSGAKNEAEEVKKKETREKNIHSKVSQSC
ncbi:hypothetical protein H6G74_10975, partial [Nostoc spongiaeforme FACHB-130]|nr:hypothetical protein [Nostoc spongiaeforme FACHB-130]